MRIPATVSAVVLVLLCTMTAQAQILPADNVIMRIRQVCNTGQGGMMVAAFEIKPRTNMWAPNFGRIGGFSVVFTYTSSKLVLTGTQQRYEPGYWGSPFRSAAYGPSAWFTQHASTGNPNSALPVSSQYFSQATDCTGNPINDEYFEIMRYTMNIHPTANGTVNLGINDVQPYNTSMYLQETQMSAIFSPDLTTNLNDSVFQAINLVIPVELASFNVSARPDGSTMLTWVTETETENMGFEIERGDGSTFERIGFVPGQGSSNEPREYSYIDRSPSTVRSDRVVFYRLKQIDYDGSHNYSDMQSAQIVPQFLGLENVYPNPVSVGTSAELPYNLPLPATVNLSVYNALGQRVASLQDQQERQAGRHTVQWNLRDSKGQLLPAGAYFVRFDATIGGESMRATQRLSIIR